ncbi:MAG: hypothetical protein OZSIB_1380 [Candidatus Ozemobacter sibiricus]|uniref:HEAT repeat domain-containing protein n=1 Tax=Candidatus Ozemobacter sibiricus TaxID=2268124 RepID=A0A367ZK94_9BACT|nr:MAG: hypothetical protein OZSIB_1380 [Candidatus Ozemobacter sibiricus]
MIWPFRPARPPAELLSDLESPDPETRRQAFATLADLDDPQADAEILARLRTLGDTPRETLFALLDLVGKRGLEEAIPLLKNLLQDEDNEIRLAALRALNRLPSQSSLDAIVPLLADADLTIRKEVREAIIRLYGDEALGALLRAVPADHTSPLYFEISSLLEDMDLFARMVENFAIPDPEVRKFHFHNMVKFHRPEFIPLYLELAETAGASLLPRIREALLEYSLDELIPPVQRLLQGNPGKAVIQLIDEVLFSRTMEYKEDLFRLAAGLSRPELRIQFLARLTRKLDPFLFLPCLDLLDDPVARVRALVFDALLSIHRSTLGRLADPNEDKKPLLTKLLEDWRQRIVTLIAQGTYRNGSLELIRLFFAMAEADHSMVRPVFTRLLTDQFGEAMSGISTWPFDDQFALLQDAVKQDPSVAALLLSGLGRTPSPDYLRLLFKLLQAIPAGDREVFKRNLEARLKGIRLVEFLEDPDPDIRMALLDILLDIGGDMLPGVLEKALKDLSPPVRLKALQTALKIRHPKIARLLEDATGDPDPEVALLAVRSLREALPPDRFTALLTRLVNSPVDEIRTYVLKEIAKITKQRYIANFKTLPPEVRKLAASAILKLDASFIDELIAELKSLDPDSRLRAAMIMENLQVGGKGRDALLAAMRDPSRKVRAAVVKTLGVIGDRTLMTQLIEFFNDPDERVRANTIEAISGFGDARATQILLPFLEDPNNRIRANAALGVWQIGKVNVLPVLQKMLNHPDPLMKASALWVLGEIKQEAHLTLIVPFVRDPQALVRLNALKAMAKIKPEALKPLLNSLRLDPSPEIRQFLTEFSYKVI